MSLEHDEAANKAMQIGGFATTAAGTVTGALVSQPRPGCTASILNGRECTNWIGLAVDSYSPAQTTAFGLFVGAIIGLLAYLIVRLGRTRTNHRYANDGSENGPPTRQ